MNKKKESKVVPNVRFKGFTDDWKQRKLLSCIQKIIDFRGRTPKKLGMDWSESGYLALSALNVKDGYIDFSQDVHYGDQALYDKWMSGNELHKGQVLFTTEAPMGNVAQVPYNKQYILSQRTIAFDVKEDIITENFLATLLKSPVVFNTLTSLSSGGTAKGVSQKSLAGVDVRIPVDLREQTLLATYFHNIDHLITLHQRKVESLIKFKKGMLQKMFPKEGCDIPEIRFKGCYDEYGNWVAFTDPWEQRKLGDLTTYRNGTGHEEKQSDVGKYELVNLNSISIDGGLKPSGKFIDEETETLIKDDLVMVLSDVGHGDLLGRVAIIPENNRFVLNQRVALLRNNGFADTKYLFSYINAHQRYFKLQGAGSSQLNISRGSVENFEVLLPKRDEQKQIGECFSNLDHLITLHQRKIDMLKKLKSACLSEMFI